MSALIAPPAWVQAAGSCHGPALSSISPTALYRSEGNIQDSTANAYHLTQVSGATAYSTDRIEGATSASSTGPLNRNAAPFNAGFSQMSASMFIKPSVSSRSVACGWPMPSRPWGSKACDLLASFDPERAAQLAGADRTALLAALGGYLDPDGDGRVALLHWQTLEERGTIGFYTERRGADGRWQRINDTLLPGLITAPMGGDYWLFDPSAGDAPLYEYRLIEQEAQGATRTHGPFRLEAQ
jgi:hypothetical protein